MAQYHVDSAEIMQASAATNAVAEQLRSNAASMLAQIQGLQTSWHGAGANAFADCATRWHHAQIQMEQALDSIALALQQASTHYEQTEAAITGMFSY